MTLDRWLTVAGVLVSALISWLFARHYYRRGERLRVPTFVVNPARRVLATAELAAIKGVSVLFDGAEAGKQGIVEAQIYFWNSGTLPILHGEILEPFAISTPGTILRASLLKTSRDVAGLRLSTPDSQRAVIDFSVLEPGDGATLGLLYDGPSDAKIEFSGACVGSPKPVVLPHNSVYFTPMRERFKETYTILWALPLFFLALAALLVSVFGIIAGAGWVLTRFFGEPVAAATGKWLLLTILVAFGVTSIGGIAWTQYKKIRAPYLPPDVHP